MEATKKKGLFSSPKLDSRIRSANVTNSERWIGYFFGPAGVILLNAILATYRRALPARSTRRIWKPCRAG